MYCSDCGKDLQAGARFCSFCGRKQTSGPAPEEKITSVSQTFGTMLRALGAGRVEEDANAWLRSQDNIKFVRVNCNASKGALVSLTLVAEKSNLPQPFEFRIKRLALKGRLFGAWASVLSSTGVEGLIEEWARENPDKRIRWSRTIHDFGHPVEAWILYSVKKSARTLT